MMLCDGRMRHSFRGVSLRKMAAVKSLEDMLSSEVDESAVTALVGSLESQLSSSTNHPPNQDANSAPVAVNHVNNNPVIDGAVVRLVDGPKHGVNSGGNQPVDAPNTSKSASNVSQDSETPSTSSNVLVTTLPGALPASGYITQVTGPTQQTYFTPVTSNAPLSTAKTLAANNQDIKIVYATQPQVVVTNSMLCSNLKSAIPNGAGNATPVSMIALRPTLPLVTACMNSVVVSTTSSMSAIHDFANIASQQTPIAITNTCTTTSVGNTLTTPVVAQCNNSKTNGRTIARMHLRGGDKSVDKNSTKGNVIAAVSTRSQLDGVLPSSCMVTSQTNIVITTTAPKTQPQLSHVNVVPQVVTNPSLLQTGVQIINVNPRLPAAALSGAKTLAPRGVLLSNPLRLTASPQIITTRPGVVGQNTITLQPGLRGTILLKTENGPLQVLNLSGTSGTGISPTTYRVQSIQPNAQGVRTMTPQPMTVTVPVCASTIKANPTVVTVPQTFARPVYHQNAPTVNTMRTQGPSVISHAPPQPVAVKLEPKDNHTNSMIYQSDIFKSLAPFPKKVSMNGSVTAPLTVQTTTANSTPSTPSQMSPNTAKKKCKNFLSTLIRLADEQPTTVAKSVRNLIQGIIDGTIQAEEFTAKLQKELNSAPQPYLVPFLKKNLPFLRHSLITKELTIEGVRPPPPGALSLPHPGSLSNSQTQTNQKRLPVPQQVRLLTTASPANLSSQLVQSSQGMGIQRFPTPRLPVVSQAKNIITTSQFNKVAVTCPVVVSSSPATVSALQAKSPLIKGSLILNAKDKSKNSFSALRDDDDINDVAAMGGVNLMEESQKILASNSELVGTQIRSCKDESSLVSSVLQRRLQAIAVSRGLEDVSPEVTALVAHAAEERLKSLIGKLSTIAEHRVENPKCDPRYEVTQDVRSQIKFLDELDKLERRRHEEQEREILLRAAKSRSKAEDPEQLKLKQKAKEMQRAELEELRQREANMTALLAIGPRKKLKVDSDTSAGTSQFGASSSSLGSNGMATKFMTRPRIKRVTYRDLLFLMEQERDLVRSPLLYKSFLNLK